MRYILAGFNGSSCSLNAVLHANEMANQSGARLHVLTVATFPTVGFEVCVDDLVEQHLSHCEVLIAALKPRLDSPDARVTLSIGHPAAEIVRYAREFGIDHIVVGCRGQWFGRWPSSATVRQVLAQAPCRVTVLNESIPAQVYAPEKYGVLKPV